MSLLLTFSFVLLLIGLIREIGFLPWISLILLGIHILIPPLDRLIDSLLKRVTHLVGNFISRVAVFLIFVLVLVPVGFLYKLTKKNPLYIVEKPKDTLWIERNKEFEEEDFRRTF